MTFYQLKMKYLTLALGLCWFCLLALSACGTETGTALPPVSVAPDVASPANSGEIKIGLIGPFSGPSEDFGIAIERGAQMAVDDINQAGGVNGRQIKLIKRDDQSKPDLGVQAAYDLIQNERVLALFGTVNSAVGIPQAAIVNRLKVPWIIPVATATAIVQDSSALPSFVFRNSMSDGEQAPFVAEYALEKGYKKMAVLTDTTDYGRGGRTAVLKTLQAAGVKPLLDEKYDVGYNEDQMKPIIRLLKTSGAEVIINWGLGPEAANIRRAQADLDYLVPVISSWGLAVSSYARLAGNSLANGTLTPQTFLQDQPPTPKGRDFVTRYQNTFNTTILDFPSGLAQSYDSMHMLLEAMRQPGADRDRLTLRSALENLGEWDGIIKTYINPWKLSDNKYWHEALTRSDFVIAVWKDGKLVASS